MAFFRSACGRRSTPAAGEGFQPPTLRLSRLAPCLLFPRRRIYAVVSLSIPGLANACQPALG